MVRKDEELLAGLGYKQEFKRDFRPLEVFGIAFSLIGLFPSASYVKAMSLSMKSVPDLHSPSTDRRSRCHFPTEGLSLWSGV